MGLVTASQFNLTPDFAGSASRGLNLGEQFRNIQLKREQEQFLQGGLQDPQALQNAAKLGLDFQAKVAAGLGLQDERTGQINQARLTEAADFSFKVQDLPIEQQNIAINKRIEEIEGRGGDATQTRQLLSIPFEQRKNAFQSVQLAALPNETRLKILQGIQSGTSEREFNNLIAGFSSKDQQVAKRIKAGLDPRATGSAIQTITEKGTAIDIAETEKVIAKSKEEGKLAAKLKFKPEISRAVKLAELEAKERGEVLTSLSRSKAALPGLNNAVDQLRELATIATSTLGGKVFDFAVKETGFGSTQGATARAKFIAIINNQVLPLLKETFGAAFTVQEGESLKATMGNPDASPEEKMVQLDAFIAQKIRDIETKETQLGQQSPAQSIPADQLKNLTIEQLQQLLNQG